MSSLPHSTLSVMALYNDIRDVGINRFIDHIESERRSHLLASELSELYQKAYTIATYSDPLQLSSHLAAAMGCGDNSVEPSEWLCIHYIHEIMAYVRDTVLPNLRAATTAAKAAASAGGGGPEALLREWVKRWKNFRQFIKGTYTIYMYLDRYHTQTLDMNIKEAAYNIYYRALWTGLDEFVAANSPVEVNAANAANAACEGRSSSATASAASACASASGDIPLRVFVPIARTPPTALNGYNAGRHPPMNPNNTQYAHSAAAQSAAANTRFTASRDLASGAPLRGGAAAKSAAASAEALALGHVTVGGFAHSAIDALCRLIESDRMATVAATVTTADAVSAAAAAGAGAGAGAAANTAAGAGASVADGAGVGESAVPLVGSTVDGALIRQAVNVFVELAQELRDVKNENTPLVLYNELQSRLNETTSQYYTALAADKLATHSLNGAGYFALVADALACEDERVRMFLHKTAQQSVFEATYGPLVSSQIQILLERSHLVPKLLHDDNPNDYNNMFRIFARNKDCLVAFAKRLHTHIRDSGAALIKRAAADETVAQAERERLIQLRKQAADRFNTEKAAAAANGLPAPAPPNFAAMGVIRSPEDLDQAAVRNLVTKLIAFYHHHMHSAQALGAEPSALQQLNEQVRLGFESFINVDERVARALAEYAGALLGKKGAAQTIGGVKPLETLANIVSLYGFVREKDVFESVYTRALHLRLLEGTSNSESEEKEFIQLLKSKSGYDWINSAEVMFSDMLASRSFGATFVNARATASRGPLRTANGDDFALEVQLCTAGSWPLAPAPAGPGANLPPADLRAAASEFATAYTQKHQGRKLQWRLDLGSAEVAVTFSEGVTRTLVVTTLMMMTLAAFNAGKIQTYRQVVASVGIASETLAPHVMSLLQASVLVSRQPGKLVDESALMINPRYNPTSHKIVVPFMRPVVTQKQVEAEKTEINVKRNMAANAAIVRILKARKEIEHNDLIAEVTRQLAPQFSADPVMLKKRIEDMIGQEYLKRDETNRSKYLYIA